MILKVLLIALAFASACATFGVDFSFYQGALSSDTFQCFVDQGVAFTNIQLWEQNGDINPDFQGNHANAKAAGIQYNDAYAFVCQTFAAEDICSDIANNLPADFSGQVWLDIEPSDGCWTGSIDSRIPFVEDVAKACQQHGLNVGIYSSYGSWESVMGDAAASSSVLNQLPLWYAHYDNDASFDDYPSVAFGGWTTPTVKQYEGDTPLCSINVDYDFY